MPTLYPDEVKPELEAIFGAKSVVKFASSFKTPGQLMHVDCKSRNAALAVIDVLTKLGIKNVTGSGFVKDGAGISFQFTTDGVVADMELIKGAAAQLQEVLKNPPSPPLSPQGEQTANVPRRVRIERRGGHTVVRDLGPKLIGHPLNPLVVPEEAALARSSTDIGAAQKSEVQELVAREMTIESLETFIKMVGIYDKLGQPKAGDSVSKSQIEAAGLNYIDTWYLLQQIPLATVPKMADHLKDAFPEYFPADATVTQVVGKLGELIATRKAGLPNPPADRMFDSKTGKIVTLEAGEILRRVTAGDMDNVGPTTFYDPKGQQYRCLSELALSAMRAIAAAKTAVAQL